MAVTGPRVVAVMPPQRVERQRGVETTDLRARMTGRSGCLPDDRIQGNLAVGRL
ncbi:hypothetical protein [Streptomyces sp. TRM75561]|uniref:hypothetical protein n=1 Tax=Streptomyces sp. TRM75561 TaxID=2975269 RepID=UPI00244AD0B5|nr:hypothetical protein [Streptomyces sp. TRM75561]MDH3038933.1 hypothetical protein [Streptomyces sp. TRM75561]